MNQLDDLLGDIADTSERDERFEVSAIKQVCRAFGEADAVTQAQEALGDEFGWAWFNGQGFTEVYFGSGRDFRFKFEDFFLRPTKHEVVLAVSDFASQLSSQPWAFVFNVYGHGKMVTSNLVFQSLSYIHVPSTHSMNIYKLAEFLKEIHDKEA